MTLFAIIVGSALFLLLAAAADGILFNNLWRLAGVVGLAQYRYTDTAIRVLTTCVAPVAAFILLAMGTAAVVPPPQEFTYASMEVNPEATFWQRNAAWVSLKTGYADVEVKPGLVYSTAEWKISETETKKFVGLPGVGKWYSL